MVNSVNNVGVSVNRMMLKLVKWNEQISARLLECKKVGKENTDPNNQTKYNIVNALRSTPTKQTQINFHMYL